MIDVIRKGLDVDNIHLTLFYPKPTAADSEESHRLYSHNQFSITRQQTFSTMRPGLELDMALFLNGIPLFTFELKNPWTHQTARVNELMKISGDLTKTIKKNGGFDKIALKNLGGIK